MRLLCAAGQAKNQSQAQKSAETLFITCFFINKKSPFVFNLHEKDKAKISSKKRYTKLSSLLLPKGPLFFAQELFSQTQNDKHSDYTVMAVAAELHRRFLIPEPMGPAAGVKRVRHRLLPVSPDELCLFTYLALCSIAQIPRLCKEVKKT